MDIVWANSDLTVEAKQLGATAWKAAEHFEEAATLLALPVHKRTLHTAALLLSRGSIDSCKLSQPQPQLSGDPLDMALLASYTGCMNVDLWLGQTGRNKAITWCRTHRRPTVHDGRWLTSWMRAFSCGRSGCCRGRGGRTSTTSFLSTCGSPFVSLFRQQLCRAVLMLCKRFQGISTASTCGSNGVLDQNGCGQCNLMSRMTQPRH